MPQEAQSITRRSTGRRSSPWSARDGRRRPWRVIFEPSVPTRAAAGAQESDWIPRLGSGS